MKPTPEDKRDGLKPKYRILHADGSPVDPGAQYFVLRLDYHDGGHDAHIAACRMAALEYADYIRDHLPALAHDLRDLVLRRLPSRPPVRLCVPEDELSCSVCGSSANVDYYSVGNAGITQVVPLCANCKRHHRVERRER